MNVQRQSSATPRVRIWLRLIGLLRPYRAWVILGIALSLVSSLAGIGLLALAGWFIASMGLAGVSGAAINYFTPAALIRTLAIVRIVGRYLERLINHEATLRVLSGLRVWLFERVLPLAPARTGFMADAELFSRLRADVDRLEHALLAVFVPIIVALLAVPVILVVQAVQIWPLALLTLIVMLLVALLLPLWLMARGQQSAAATVTLEAEQRALASDTLRGAAELALYGAHAERGQRLRALTDDAARVRAKVDRLQGWGSAAVPLAAQLTAAASVVLAVGALREGTLAPANVAMLVLLALAAFELVATLPEALTQLAATAAAAERVFTLADIPPAISDPASSLPAPRQFDLNFRDVRMRYAADARLALDGVNFELPQGTRLAITGPSGAGKSSLLNALLRWYPISEGRIELDGQPIEAYAADDVRSAIAVVEQRTHIFNASLRENLLIGRPDADMAQIAAAVASAQLQDFVARLPQGLDTSLGEGGVRISGGEARRVAIARALLADRPILILDEPTEGLDAATAQSLFSALAEAMRGRSVLVITHRLEGLTSLVDRRLRMRDGSIETPETAPPD